MSKTGRIINRAVTVLMALAVLPNLYFNGLLYIRVDPGMGDFLWGDSFSIADFAPGGIFNGVIRFDGGGTPSEHLLLLRPAIVAGVLLALAALVLVAIAVIAAVSNKKLPVLILCGVSAALIIGAYISLGKFAGRVMAPGFELMQLLGENTLTSILGAFVHPEVLMVRFSGAVSLMLVICGAIAAWTAAFQFTAPREAKQKA